MKLVRWESGDGNLALPSHGVTNGGCGDSAFTPRRSTNESPFDRSQSAQHRRHVTPLEPKMQFGASVSVKLLAAVSKKVAFKCCSDSVCVAISTVARDVKNNANMAREEIVCDNDPPTKHEPHTAPEAFILRYRNSYSNIKPKTTPQSESTIGLLNPVSARPG